MSIGLWITVILSAWLFLGFLTARLYVWYNKGIETPVRYESREVYDEKLGYRWEAVEIPPVYITPADCLFMVGWGALGFVVLVAYGVGIGVQNIGTYFKSDGFRKNRAVNSLFGLKG